MSEYIRNLSEDPVVLSDSDEYERGVMDAQYDRSTSNPVNRDWFNSQPEGYRIGYLSITAPTYDNEG